MKLKNIVESKEKESTQNDNKGRPDPFQINIEQESIHNKDYRRVIFTAEHCQLVLMSIDVGDEIGEEVHKVDQFIRADAGRGESIINGKKRSFGNGDAVVVPAGALHNIINTGDEPLKLYTVYSPPQHLHNTLQKTKADEKEDHFDGVTDVKK